MFPKQLHQYSLKSANYLVKIFSKTLTFTVKGEWGNLGGGKKGKMSNGGKEGGGGRRRGTEKGGREKWERERGEREDDKGWPSCTHIKHACLAPLCLSFGLRIGYGPSPPHPPHPALPHPPYTRTRLNYWCKNTPTHGGRGGGCRTKRLTGRIFYTQHECKGKGGGGGQS